MDCFLAWLEKYDLLIELVLTILTIALSLYAVFQTWNVAKRQLEQEKNIAEQQANLQERQIKISLYERKDEINKVLNTIFEIVSSLNVLFRTGKMESLAQDKAYEVLKQFMNKVDTDAISYTLEQSRLFLSKDLFAQIQIVKIRLDIITSHIECLDLLKDDEEVKNTSIGEIRKSIEKIVEMQPTIESEMIQEMEI